MCACRTAVIIPARYQSTRFPGKPLALLAGKPMIRYVYEAASSAEGVDITVVATDDERIRDAVVAFGGEAVMTSPQHSCGTERVAECAEKLGLGADDLVVNVQGDEPLLRAAEVRQTAELLRTGSAPMCTLRCLLRDEAALCDPNVVKVTVGLSGMAIAFSRSPIPYSRGGCETLYWRHVGIYGYRKWFLECFASLPRGPLERAEQLEQLRALENGYQILVGQTQEHGFGVDTPEQLAAAERIILNAQHGTV